MSYKNKLSNSLEEVRKSFEDYFKYFSHPKDIASSVYFLFSLAFSVILCLLGLYQSADWLQLPLGILPNILGFTLGGYAIIISLGTEEFKKFLINKKLKNGQPLFLVVNAQFLHFIIIQVVTILVAVLIKAICPTNIVLSIFGGCLFVYSIVLAVATAFVIMTMSTWYQQYVESKKKE